jgi:hypothetical protein
MLYLFGVRQVTNSLGAYEEVVRIAVAFHGVGQYALDSSAVELDEVVGGDGITAAYDGTGASAGVLDITAYGGPGSSLEGTVRFDARRHRSASSPIIRFEDGRFRVSVVLLSASSLAAP